MKPPTSDYIKIAPGFWTGLSQLGITAPDVARKAQLPFSIISETTVTTTQYFSIWEAYSDLIGDTAEAIIKLATVFDTATYPPTVLATYHSRDYRDALNRMVRYKKRCPPESLRITEENDSCKIELEWLDKEHTGPHILIGITLAFLLELGRRGTGQPLTAQFVEFSHGMGDMRTLEKYFGCRIQTGAKCNRLTLHRSDLDRSFTTYNEELLEILTPALDQSLHEQQYSHSIAEVVTWIIKRNLAGGNFDIQAVAKQLSMSDRTLQRRLAAQDTSFKHLLAQVKHEQARVYLQDPTLDIKDVAFLVGYEDQNSFYRAFHLWEGITPLTWRNKYVGKNPIR
ncbi:AraC family transcriptional regulator [Paenibacillus assamensis]|uniref:AraC family transcriptional regulator n=1 Tax=Paenibacillus assamensis TaxID=311244 RepID=UPI000408B151|nr:AraC family transcriptional regulator [Paenibacillus assamensis]